MTLPDRDHKGAFPPFESATRETFCCSECNETYQLHWLASDCSGLCRKCADLRDGFCRWADEHPQHLDLHPCGTSTEEPGSPCRYCAAPVPLSGDPCPNCWQTFDGMNVADVKALFAADADGREDSEAVFDIKPAVGGDPA